MEFVVSPSFRILGSSEKQELEHFYVFVCVEERKLLSCYQ